ncbi:hypothetical protein DSUL_70001 [Desulfovibrionales bacterium]
MDNYLTGQEFIDKYNIKLFQLYELIGSGLTPYNENGVLVKSTKFRYSTFCCIDAVFRATSKKMLDIALFQQIFLEKQVYVCLAF